MNNLENKRKKILNLSIAAIVLIPIAIIFIIAGVVTTAFTSNIELVGLYIFGIILIIPAGIIGLVASILTLVFPSFIPEIETKKIIFGILGIVLVGPLMPLIFACTIKKEIEQYNNSNNQEIVH